MSQCTEELQDLRTEADKIQKWEITQRRDQRERAQSASHPDLDLRWSIQLVESVHRSRRHL